MTDFTPVASMLGGMLIGLSAVILMAFNGRIAGISGIVSRLIRADFGGTDNRPGLWFLLGLLIAAPIWRLVAGEWPAQTVPSNLPLMLITGGLVGFGATLGNGCTSGHGVCGISRLSVRSLVATCVFMTVAVLTVFVMRHVVGA